MTLHRSPLRRKAVLVGAVMKSPRSVPRDLPRPAPRKARPVSPASPAQRRKVAGKACVHCGQSPCDPAHVIPRGMLTAGQDDPRAVVALCRQSCHRRYDSGDLDLLPALEAHARDELAFAVLRFGLVGTLRRVTNDRHAC